MTRKRRKQRARKKIGKYIPYNYFPSHWREGIEGRGRTTTNSYIQVASIKLQVASEEREREIRTNLQFTVS